jgi:hypothetical protein
VSRPFFTVIYGEEKKKIKKKLRAGHVIPPPRYLDPFIRSPYNRCVLAPRPVPFPIVLAVRSIVFFRPRPSAALESRPPSSSPHVASTVTSSGTRLEA